jgi:hypothetical protein
MRIRKNPTDTPGLDVDCLNCRYAQWFPTKRLALLHAREHSTMVTHAHRHHIVEVWRNEPAIGGRALLGVATKGRMSYV